MTELKFIYAKIAVLIKSGLFEYKNNHLTAYKAIDESSPILYSEKLREHLVHLAMNQAMPVLYQDKYQVYFGCIRLEDGFLFVGPFPSRTLDPVELHRYYKEYGISVDMEKKLPRYFLQEILNSVELLAVVSLNRKYMDEELLCGNRIIRESKNDEIKEKILLEFWRDADDIHHHSYRDEQRLLDYEREGSEEDAIQYNKEMDAYTGRLSKYELNHWKNLIIVAVTLCTRAAIEGGATPVIAYQISDFYIQKADTCTDIARLINYRNNAVRDLIRQVQKERMNGACSIYVQKCKHYVKTHFREKIHLNNVAQMLGISSSYLSKLFKKETGVKFQDYIIEKRVTHAASLLQYSEESIASIGDYVNFPSQSYFGKMFKRFKNMTPAAYRENHKSPADDK
jgi:AraC-like DNA-binding protein